MRPRSFIPRLEEMESRLVPSAPSSAPALPAPPPPGPSSIWVSTEADLQNAVQNLQSGQTIVIQPGTYHLSQTLNIGLNHQISNVTIRGATNKYGDVVLVGHGMNNANYGNTPDGIDVWNAQNVTIADLTIGAVWFHPIHLHGDWGASSVSIYHDRLYNAGEQFVKADASSTKGVDNSSVQYCVIEYTNAPPNIDHGGGTGYTNGVDVKGSSNWVVANNLFQNFHTPDSAANLWDPAVLFWDHTVNPTVVGNTFINTDRAIALGLIQQSSGYDNQGGLIANNFIYDKPGMFTSWRKQGADAPIIVWDSPGTSVYNNTILTNGNYPNSIQTRWVSGDDIRNNLADASLLGRSGSTFTQSNNYLQATTDMFVNAAAGDLHLVNNSNTQAHVIGKGKAMSSVTTDWDGDTRPTAAVDIGADQF
jgi:hypothetical protein